MEQDRETWQRPVGSLMEKMGLKSRETSAAGDDEAEHGGEKAIHKENPGGLQKDSSDIQEKTDGCMCVREAMEAGITQKDDRE